MTLALDADLVSLTDPQLWAAEASYCYWDQVEQGVEEPRLPAELVECNLGAEGFRALGSLGLSVHEVPDEGFFLRLLDNRGDL